MLKHQLGVKNHSGANLYGAGCTTLEGSRKRGDLYV